jgi:hypothetical protein
MNLVKLRSSTGRSVSCRLVERRRHVGPIGAQQGRPAGHLDDFSQRADVHREVHGRLRVDADLHARHQRRPEPFELGAHLVGARQQALHLEEPGLVRHGRVDRLALEAGHRHGHARQHAAAAVDDRAADAAVHRLRDGLGRGNASAASVQPAITQWNRVPGRRPRRVRNIGASSPLARA